MFAPHLARLAAFALVAFGGMTAAAFAAEQPASTSGFANLREGPGTSYSVITTLDPGTGVTVHACTGTWCAVTTEDEDDGFLAKSLLNFDDAPDMPQPASDAEVCFYQGPGFSDANFCVAPGDADDQIPGSFNNAIESILISGGASIEVCTGSAMSGTCATYDHSVKTLPFALRNKISSYAVDSGDSGDVPADLPDSSVTFTLN